MSKAKSSWHLLFAKCQKMVGESGERLYERAVMIRQIWSDTEFQNDMTDRKIKPADEINKLTADLHLIRYSDLIRMLKVTNDNKSLWSVGNIEQIFFDAQRDRLNETRKDSRTRAEAKQLEQSKIDRIAGSTKKDPTRGAPDRPTHYFVTTPLQQYESALESTQVNFDHNICKTRIIGVMRREFANLSKKEQMRITREFARSLGMELVSRKKAFA